MDGEEKAVPRVTATEAERMLGEGIHIVGDAVVEDQLVGDQIVGAAVLALIDPAELDSVVRVDDDGILRWR